MSNILAPEVLSRIDAFYDAALTPKLHALEDWRRQVRWLIIKSLLVVLPPIVFLIGGDLFDSVLPFRSSAKTIAFGWVWLIAGLAFVLVKYLLPGIAAYANYRSRFKKEIVGEIFKVVCPSAAYDPLQGIAQEVFDAPGLFNLRGSFHSDDRVRGRIGQTSFEVSEVRRAYSSGTGKHRHSYEVFSGLFFHLAFNQEMSGVTLVDPERAQSHQIGDRAELSLVTFDHPAFEKEFKVYTSNESEARALLTPATMEALLTLRREAGKPVFLAFKAQRAYVGVHYGRTLFEPSIIQSTSKDAVREIAEHFALVETIVRELSLNSGPLGTDAGDALLQGPDIEPNPLSQLAAEKAGAMTTAELWTMAASIDHSAKDGAALVPRPEGTRIRVEQGPGSVSITYGLRIGFWVILAISLSGALLATSALRAEDAPAWAAPVSTWARTLPPLPLDAFTADAPMPWLIVGTIVALLFALSWTGYVRSVSVDVDRIRIYRGFRPFPRIYRRPEYGRAIRINSSVYIAKSQGVHMLNPTASPVLTEPEAKWLTSEMRRALGQA